MIVAIPLKELKLIIKLHIRIIHHRLFELLDHLLPKPHDFSSKTYLD